MQKKFLIHHANLNLEEYFVLKTVLNADLKDLVGEIDKKKKYEFKANKISHVQHKFLS